MQQIFNVWIFFILETSELMELYQKLPAQNFSIQQFYGGKFLKLRYDITKHSHTLTAKLSLAFASGKQCITDSFMLMYCLLKFLCIYENLATQLIVARSLCMLSA